MPRWNGGVIGAANNPTSSSAKGIWSLSEATKAIRAGLWPPSNAGADPYFENVTLLLPGDGTNGAQNNTFLDSSTNNFTITRNGNTTQGTFSPFSKVDGRWGVAFDDSGDQLTIASNAALGMGTGDFTIEFWYYHLSRSSGDTICAPSTDNLNIYINSSGVLGYYQGSSQNSSQTVPLNTWVHIALVRSGSTVKMYYNGTEVLSHSNSINYATASWYIGTNPGGVDPSHGVVSNLRIVKGTAVYTAAFTVPTAPLTAITNTVLLTCQSNRFKDNSTNAFAITRNGDVAVTTFSPFPTMTAYAAGTNGGSGYFDGSGDYLECSSNSAFSFGTGNLTVEAWIYRAASGTFPIFANGAASSGSFSLYIYNDKLEGAFYGGTSLTGATSLTVNAWHHVAIVRSGTTLSLYLNGTRDATTTSSSNNTSSNCVIARDWTNGSAYSNGYISSLRVVKGTAVYDPSVSTLTVPTAPLTAVTNTSLLTNFTNGGIIDTSMSNDLETVGNAQISTTQSKFGGASMSFDGTGDWLAIPAGDKFAFGSGDYTVEAWIYFNSITNTDLQIIFMSGSTGGNTFYFHADGNQLSVGTASVLVSNQSTTFNTGTWYHVAACRSGTTLRLFVNGTQIGSNATDSTSWISSGTARVGSNESGGQTVNGYIDDLRVTKGYARYTSNFTAPVGPFNGFGD